MEQFNGINPREAGEYEGMLNIIQFLNPDLSDEDIKNMYKDTLTKMGKHPADVEFWVQLFSIEDDEDIL